MLTFENNLNFLLPSGFQLYIEKIPRTIFKCIKVSFPSINTNSININTPTLDYPISGYKLTFDSLVLTFIVDEDMKNFDEIKTWFNSMANPESLSLNDSFVSAYKQLYHTNRYNANFSNGILTILNSNNNPNHEFLFKDMYPTKISDIILTSTDTDLVYRTCQVEFNYSYIEY